MNNPSANFIIMLAIGLSTYSLCLAQAVPPKSASTQLAASSTADGSVSRPLVIIAAPDYATIKTDAQIAAVVEDKVAERVAASLSAVATDTPVAREERHALQRSILAAQTIEERDLILYTEVAIETVVTEKAAHEAGVTARLSASAQKNR